MEDRPSCPDGGIGQSALAPQSVSVLKPQSREANLLPAKKFDTSNEVRTTSTALTDSVVRYNIVHSCRLTYRLLQCGDEMLSMPGGSFLPHRPVGLC
jgi:hypothetical protein